MLRSLNGDSRIQMFRGTPIKSVEHHVTVISVTSTQVCEITAKFETVH